MMVRGRENDGERGRRVLERRVKVARKILKESRSDRVADRDRQSRME